jgi:hypothetical protein
MRQQSGSRKFQLTKPRIWLEFDEASASSEESGDPEPEIIVANMGI